jgi:hypothetical protein
MYFLVVDTRFASPVYVFLEQNPHAEPGFPGLAVRSVELQFSASEPRWSSGNVVAQNPRQSDHFRMFRSDGEAAAAGYGVVEPRFVGANWNSYRRVFDFGARRVPRI